VRQACERGHVVRQAGIEATGDHFLVNGKAHPPPPVSAPPKNFPLPPGKKKFSNYTNTSDTECSFLSLIQARLRRPI